MVVLEAAAIGAAGYGLYKGGEAGLKKGNEIKKEYQRESKRYTQRNELSTKTNARKDRISKIMNMRNGVSNGGTTNNATTASSFTNINTSSSSTNTPSWMNPESTSSSTRTASTASSSVEDRHSAVMAKLRASRKEESKKNKNGGLFKNPFGSAKRK